MCHPGVQATPHPGAASAASDTRAKGASKLLLVIRNQPPQYMTASTRGKEVLHKGMKPPVPGSLIQLKLLLQKALPSGCRLLTRLPLLLMAGRGL